MAKAKANAVKILYYKEKPLVRRGSMIYYGNPADPYIILMIVNSTRKVGDMEVSESVTIQLQENSRGKDRIIKKAEREGMFAAMDIAEYWLSDALSQVD